MTEYLLQKEGGFFSEFFFMVNNYIYCKKTGEKFILNTNNWIYKSSLGWTDYFETFYENVYTHDFTQQIPINELNGPPPLDACPISNLHQFKQYKFGNIRENCSISEYKQVISEIYKYNITTKNKIREINETLALCETEYGAIYIRRGDKLLYESRLHQTHIYIQTLLRIMPTCPIIFIQTDDYTCILEAETYIKENNLNIKICTTCPKNYVGSFANAELKNSRVSIKKNVNYVNSIRNNIDKYKSIDEMNADEIYNHTIELISGVDIVLHSKYCVLDYQSNVSRFIKLAHPIYDNVIDIEGNNIDLNKCICPSYPESVYDDPDTIRHT